MTNTDKTKAKQMLLNLPTPDFQTDQERADYWYKIDKIAAALSSPAVEPVAWRWRPRGSSGTWIYDPTPEWINSQDPEKIEAEPLYAHPPVTGVSEAPKRVVTLRGVPDKKWTVVAENDERVVLSGPCIGGFQVVRPDALAGAGANPKEPQWSAWIPWPGGECPIPWANGGEWGLLQNHDEASCEETIGELVKVLEAIDNGQIEPVGFGPLRWKN